MMLLGIVPVILASSNFISIIRHSEHVRNAQFSTHGLGSDVEKFHGFPDVRRYDQVGPPVSLYNSSSTFRSEEEKLRQFLPVGAYVGDWDGSLKISAFVSMRAIDSTDPLSSTLPTRAHSPYDIHEMRSKTCIAKWLHGNNMIKKHPS